MLKKAIAMSLEEETGVRFTKGENEADEHNNFQAARSHRPLLMMMMGMRKRKRCCPSKKKQVRDLPKEKTRLSTITFRWHAASQREILRMMMVMRRRC